MNFEDLKVAHKRCVLQELAKILTESEASIRRGDGLGEPTTYTADDEFVHQYAEDIYYYIEFDENPYHRVFLRTENFHLYELFSDDPANVFKANALKDAQYTYLEDCGDY